MEAPPHPICRPFRSRAFLGHLLVITLLGCLPVGFILAGAAIEFWRPPGGWGAEVVRLGIVAYFFSLFGLIGMLFLIPELEEKLTRSERSALTLACLLSVLGSTMCFGGLAFII